MSVKPTPLLSAGSIRLHDLFGRLRAESGLSFHQIAERAQVNVAHVNGLEKGTKRMSRDRLIRLALAMALDVEQADQLLRSAGYLPLLPLEEERALKPVESALVESG